ncbi:beta-ketoacyl-ACP synthase II [bacterium]|nr:beta-ketoacyl-ACP synthase II [bacterium]
MGMISPLGLTVQENWTNVTSGVSGVGPITQFNCEKFDVKIAAEVKGFDPSVVIEKKEQKKMDRFTQFAIYSAHQAIVDSGLDFASNEILRARTGAVVGVGIGGLSSIEEQNEIFLNRGPGRITPFFIPLVITNMASGHISIRYGLRGPNFSVTSACASGVHSVGEAAKYIQSGTCDVMIAGGVEAAVTPLAVAGFSSMRALSSRNDEPTKASRPFDRNRDGFVLAEGGAVMILEDYEHASRRGAKIYAELTGYGVSSDAYHMTSPPPDGAGAAMAMRMALKSAQLTPEKISYINAHGTSTPTGDGIESTAIKFVFGDHAKKLWVSSTKSMTGHALGGAGALESVYSLLTLKNQIAPPTINLESPSDDCDLDYVPNHARDGKFEHVLNNSFGFGGTNACVIFSKI